ncbi:GGDEF domain-containing protein [Marinospirillum perlucidum]|uniref:GGDEF domain-containing protein n=1 Tax=Marinospirillum perlucidum TaxID=1982602 RepID=UPI000DF4942F|nr:GGDEF domain-containing protein [Marinospirillum perlucidum]
MAGCFFALLAGWCVYADKHTLSLIYLSGTLLFLVASLPTSLIKPAHRYRLTLWVFCVYTLVSLALLLTPEHYTSLTFLSLHLAFPFIAFGLLTFHTALFFVLGFALLANLLVMLHLEGSLRLTFLAAIWLMTLLTSIHSFTHHLRQQNLKELLSRDPVTGLFNRKQLINDVKKEQQRAQREATSLGLLKLTTPNNEPWTNKQIQDVSQAFAPFERLYYFSSQRLAVLLPLATDTQLDKRTQELIEVCPDIRVDGSLCALDALPASLVYPDAEQAREGEG